jgi:hypothetical protein
MEESNRFSSYTHGEGRTGKGQLVEFTCHPDDAEKVRKFLSDNVRTIDIPVTSRVSVSHGGYGQYTRYDIKQHDYAGGGPGEGGGWCYIEVLEIKNPPDSRWGIVVNECESYRGSVFTEWDTVENACAVFAKHWGSSRKTAEEDFPKLPGFKRRVVCGALTPWFYAIGDEQLIGDYAFPEGLQDDPVYRFGRQFVVFDSNDIPLAKTCMGTRFIKDQSPYRLVYWDDGSVWNESYNRVNSPRPVEEGEIWITEAVQEFRQLLAGKSTEFAINFTDGNKFAGKLTQANRRGHCAEGDYYVVANIKGQKKPIDGWVWNFKPTQEAPDIVLFVTQQLKKNKGQEAEKIEIKKCKTKKGGKKWLGAFFPR